MSNFLNKPYIQAVGNCQTVILSDSLMAHLWKENEFNVKERPSFHCLVGAKIQDIQKLLPSIQNENAKMIVCVGINNVPSQSSARIIVQFQKLAESIGKEHVFCKLPYPPKFCERNGVLNSEMIQKITEINTWIKSWNKHPTVDLAKYGSFFKNGLLQFKFEDWKEKSSKKMLHFSSTVKKSICQKIVTVFHSMDVNNNKIKLSWEEGHTSLSLAKDFIPQITPVITDVCSIPGLVSVNKMPNRRKITCDSVRHSFQNKVKFKIPFILIYQLSLI